MKINKRINNCLELLDESIEYDAIEKEIIIRFLTSTETQRTFLSPMEQLIYDNLLSIPLLTIQIADFIGSDTKNVSSLLLKMYEETDLIKKHDDQPKRFKWSRA